MFLGVTAHLPMVTVCVCLWICVQRVPEITHHTSNYSTSAYVSVRACACVRVPVCARACVFTFLLEPSPLRRDESRGFAINGCWNMAHERATALDVI